MLGYANDFLRLHVEKDGNYRITAIFGLVTVNRLEITSTRQLPKVLDVQEIFTVQLLPVHQPPNVTSHLMPGGYIPRQEIMERECWKFLDSRLNSDNDSRLHGQPSSSPTTAMKLVPVT